MLHMNVPHAEDVTKISAHWRGIKRFNVGKIQRKCVPFATHECISNLVWTDTWSMSMDYIYKANK